MLWPLPSESWDYRYGPARPINSEYFDNSSPLTSMKDWCLGFSLEPHSPEGERPGHFKSPLYLRTESSMLVCGFHCDEKQTKTKTNRCESPVFPSWFEKASDEGRRSKLRWSLCSIPFFWDEILFSFCIPDALQSQFGLGKGQLPIQSLSLPWAWAW